MSYFTHEQIEEIRQRLGLVPQEELAKLTMKGKE